MQCRSISPLKIVIKLNYISMLKIIRNLLSTAQFIFLIHEGLLKKAIMMGLSLCQGSKLRGDATEKKRIHAVRPLLTVLPGN